MVPSLTLFPGVEISVDGIHLLVILDSKKGTSDISRLHPESFNYVVTKQHLDILRNETDAFGRKLEIVILEIPEKIRDKYANNDFVSGYVNFYVCSRAVIAPEFGDKRTNTNARNKLEMFFPNRDVVQLNINAIVADGGGSHCTIQQEPMVS